MREAPPIRPMRVIAWSAAVGVTLTALALFPSAISVVLVGFAGIILGVYLRGITTFLRRHVRIPRAALLLFVVLVHLAAIALFLMWAVPAMTSRFQQVTDDVAVAWSDLQALIEGTWLGSIVSALPSPQRIIAENPDLSSQVFGLFSNAVFGMIALVIILFVGLYLAWAPKSYLTGLLILFPPDRRDRAAAILQELYVTLGRWVAGRTLSAAIIGVLTGLGVWALGVPLPLPLAVLAAVLTYIPNVGPILTLIPASLLGLTQGWEIALGAVGVYAVVQFIESNLLTPLIERWAVHVPPALLLVTQALLGVLMGLLGVALAAPIIAVAMVLVRRLYVEDRLGDEGPEPEDVLRKAREEHEKELEGAPSGAPAPA